MLLASPTVHSNLSGWLEWAGIDAADLQIQTGDADSFPDRVWLLDPKFRILSYLLQHGASVDSDISARAFHGSSVVLSLRERSSPSLQLCVHRGHDAATNSSYLIFEVDFDKAPPTSNPKFVSVHLREVIVNAITSGKTDQASIQKGLVKRGVIAV